MQPMRWQSVETRAAIANAFAWATEPAAGSLRVYAGRRALGRALDHEVGVSAGAPPAAPDVLAARELCVAVALWGEALAHAVGQPRSAALAFAYELAPPRVAQLSGWVRRLRHPPIPSLPLEGELETLVCAVLRDRPDVRQRAACG